MNADTTASDGESLSEQYIAERERAAREEAVERVAARIARAEALIDAWEHDAPGLVEPTFVGRLREVLRRDPAPVRLRDAARTNALDAVKAQAKAEALREAAHEMAAYSIGPPASNWRQHGWSNWLRARADRIGGA